MIRQRLWRDPRQIDDRRRPVELERVDLRVLFEQPVELDLIVRRQALRGPVGEQVV